MQPIIEELIQEIKTRIASVIHPEELGNKVEPRREFIERHAKDVKNLDV